MKVYMVADRGCKTTFKITRAHVLSKLDNVISELVDDYDKASKYIKEWSSLYEYLYKGTERNTIYVTEVDDLDNNAKKLKLPEWIKLVDDYISKNDIKEIKKLK